MPQHVSEFFTLPGRILAFVTLMISVGGPIAYFYWIKDELSPGRYPIWFFALPILVAAIFFFAIMAAILNRLGIKVYNEPAGDEQRETDLPEDQDRS